MAAYTLKLLDAVGRVSAETWDGLANPGWRLGPGGTLVAAGTPSAPFNPFVSHAFLTALEESDSVGGESGWWPCPLILADDEDGGEIRAVAPAYLKSHSLGEYVFDQGWADAWERAGGRYYPKLQLAVPFTPVTGPRLLAADAMTRRALADGIVRFVRERRLSSAHVTFAGEADVAALTGRGFLLRTDLQFRFENRGYGSYDDFLGALASRKRKALKHERHEALKDGIDVEWLSGSDLTEAHWDAFFAFYMDTGARKWGHPYLNRRFFSLVSEKMAGRILLVMAKRGGRPIAGALNFIGSDRLYGRNWGTIEEHPFLHFELCYHQAIDYAILHRLAIVEAGAQGEHKLSRGYMPVETRSAHFIADPGLRAAVADFLGRERAAIAAAGAALAAEGPFRRGPLQQDRNGEPSPCEISPAKD